MLPKLMLTLVTYSKERSGQEAADPTYSKVRREAADPTYSKVRREVAGLAFSKGEVAVVQIKIILPRCQILAIILY